MFIPPPQGDPLFYRKDILQVLYLGELELNAFISYSFHITPNTFTFFFLRLQLHIDHKVISQGIKYKLLEGLSSVAEKIHLPTNVERLKWLAYMFHWRCCLIKQHTHTFKFKLTGIRARYELYSDPPDASSIHRRPPSGPAVTQNRAFSLDDKCGAAPQVSTAWWRHFCHFCSLQITSSLKTPPVTLTWSGG